MDMIFKNLVIRWLILFMALSCTGKNSKSLILKNPVPPTPAITLLAELADSNQPVVKSFVPAKKIRAGNPVIHSFEDTGSNDTSLPEEQAEGFFSFYKSEDGLPIDAINCGISDLAGNLWFGSFGGGACRYDGRSFSIYTTEHGLSNNSIFAIKQTSNGDIWFGTASGASRFDGKSFTNYTTQDGLANNIVTCITGDKSGNVWLGTYGGGLSRFDGYKFVNFTSANSLAENKILAITEDKSGNLWVGTEHGLSIYNGKIFINPGQVQDLSIGTIAEDNHGNIWLGTHDGLFTYKNGFDSNKVAEKFLPGNISCITKDREGTLWIATHQKGLARYDGKIITMFNSKNGFPDYYVSSICEDKSGNLWFGTSEGVIRYGGKSFMNFGKAHGLGDDLISGMIEDKNGNIWFGSGKGVTRYDGKNFSTYTGLQGLLLNNARPRIQDKNGDIWITTNNGLSRFDGESFTTYTETNGFTGDAISSIIQTSKGILWFGSGTNGAFCFDGRNITHYSEMQGLVSNAVYCMTEDFKGAVWFGTDEGVSCFDGKSFKSYTTKNGLLHKYIYSSAIDRAGNLWFGTAGGGASRFDGKSFMNFTVGQGLPDNNIFSIVIDSAGKLIFGTNAGLAVLSSFNNYSAPGKQPNAMAQNELSNDVLKKYNPQFEIYNATSGYPIKDLIPRTMVQDKNGKLWLSTGTAKTGLIRFDYSSVHRDKEPAMPILHHVKINNEKVCWYNLLPPARLKGSGTGPNITEEVSTLGSILTEQDRDSMRNEFRGIRFDTITSFYPVPGNLVLPYRLNNISFDFGCIEYTSPNLVRYQYMLEGYDSKWNPVTSQASVTYGNIREGNYSFKLRAQNPSGKWSPPLLYSFKVLPPWYRTWWAFILYAIMLSAVVSAIVQYRSQRLTNEKRLLEEKVAQRTNQLSDSLKELKQTQAQLIHSEKMASLGELTAGIAHEIQNPLNFVNNFSEVSTEMLEEMKEELVAGNPQHVIEIAGDLQDNLTKILHHGKRADAIVKGMLEHSRASSGIKEPVNINALAQEYLGLTYHGLKAKEPSLDITIHTEYDETINMTQIVAQDIGRVLLNLYNNAFYAVAEKARQGIPAYEPTVSVSTKKTGDKIAISVKDNGNGIPIKNIDKIFQPFFTTKPTGQGTGLGLSLSYDIVHAHGGEITVKTNEILPGGQAGPGEGSEFVVVLPA